MSVAIEEMLHLSLSSNLKQALTGQPQLVNKSPDVWPAYLAGHEPPLPINRAASSKEQLKTFLKNREPFSVPYFIIELAQFEHDLALLFDDHENTRAIQFLLSGSFLLSDTLQELRTYYYHRQHLFPLG